jgi:hypothetical protein
MSAVTRLCYGNRDETTDNERASHNLIAAAAATLARRHVKHATPSYVASVFSEYLITGGWRMGFSDNAHDERFPVHLSSAGVLGAMEILSALGVSLRSNKNYLDNFNGFSLKW